MAGDKLLLFELAGRDRSVRFSPFCWRTRLAVAHKGLHLQTTPMLFSEKQKIAPFGTDRVPVLQDGKQTIFDSWNIAEYLEDTYGDRPSLFGSPAAKGLSRFIGSWADLNLQPLILRAIIQDVYEAIDDRDRAYFRASREARFGRPLEEMFDAADSARAALTGALEPIRSTLVRQRFLSGDQPTYSDYIVCAALQWARLVRASELLASGDPIIAWRDRILDRYHTTASVGDA